MNDNKHDDAVAVPTTGAVRDPVAAFGVGAMRIDDGVVVAEQQLGPRFADHRGLIDLPAYAVLFDHIGGIPYHRATDSPCMQARLALSTVGRAGLTDHLTGTAQLLMHDAKVGVTEIRVGDGTEDFCVGTARNVAVGRAVPDDFDNAELAHDIPDAASLDAVLAQPIPDDLDGETIVAQIARGERDRGPLAELLNATIDADGAPSNTLRLVVDTEAWMGNMFGTMHGGVIGTIVGAACSLTGQQKAHAGQEYRVGDLSVAYFRSPPVDGSRVIVDVEPLKVGRRIATFSTRMTGADGTLLAEGAADIHFR
ncbi:hypothetical protein A5788_08050 [Gordonia sp. 852002-50816_SCH5313054-c]|uniref:PaaI family thioesterase n=1 Tax=unclassified Gordonia (in: high G+C Gram-positive bacteria) TaxID=2657482 RepID=UPI0007EA090A|nr:MULTISPECIES: PaaI family thioesterase [unclassified Gordonia (in: high G+C Gram-positive bacteria)]OBC12544.1 hypothetical protein A5786_03065 [Gordonia sp. 852002-50816_SCH5313054-a]OBC19545.1 hypothetical protein A5788_08050 [Gordonia sp. 852002-50816_SCH5313054-c]